MSYGLICRANLDFSKRDGLGWTTQPIIGLKRLLNATKSLVSTHAPVPDTLCRRGAGPDATAIDFGALCAFAGRHPARRVWALAGQQRPALLRPGHSRRSGEEVHQRKEYDPLQDAEGRHADPARPVRQPQRRQNLVRFDRAEIYARTGDGLRGLSRAA